MEFKSHMPPDTYSSTNQYIGNHQRLHRVCIPAPEKLTESAKLTVDSLRMTRKGAPLPSQGLDRLRPSSGPVGQFIGVTRQVIHTRMHMMLQRLAEL